jgi:hypothetical protein
MPHYQAVLTRGIGRGLPCGNAGVGGFLKKLFKKPCASPKSSAILTGSADKTHLGLTLNAVGGGGKKIF